MSGWELSQGALKTEYLSEDRLWSVFNYVFVGGSRKRTSYKFGLIKSILDNLLNAVAIGEEHIYISYDNLFFKFTHNYWDLVTKYNLKQMRADGKAIYSKIELIIRNEMKNEGIVAEMQFASLNYDVQKRIVKKVTEECKKYVLGALYGDTEGCIFGFDKKQAGIVINLSAYNFMLKYKLELEKLNYYAWAKFLEEVNDDNVLVRVLDKLELATPKRADLSIYRNILRREFEQSTCFYCGRKFNQVPHVDHFIPWSFVKEDKLWNFVLSCSSCNSKKSNKLPQFDYIQVIKERNKEIQRINLPQKVLVDFESYTEDIIERMWIYSEMGGYKKLTF